MESVTNFRCYQDNGFSLLNVNGKNCDYIPENSLGEQKATDDPYKILISGDVMRIQGEYNSSDPVSVVVIAINGINCIICNKFIVNEDIIDIGNMPKGVYFVFINNTYNHKFTVQ